MSVVDASESNQNKLDNLENLYDQNVAKRIKNHVSNDKIQSHFMDLIF